MIQTVTFAGLFATMAMVSVASVKAETSDYSDASLSFATNNTLATLLHEFGHAAIDQLRLPVLGQEEGAADSFSTLEIVQSYDSESAMAILLDVADAQLIAHEEAEESGLLDYYGAHDLEAQRAYRAICHLYGTDPRAFSDAANWARLPRERKESCQYDAELAWDSWDQLLERYQRRDGDRAQVIKVNYGRGKMRAVLMKTGVLEEVAEVMTAALAWPAPVRITAATCGEANAYYDPEAVEITICYEFFQEYLEIAPYTD